jgi:hypothetical protein
MDNHQPHERPPNLLDSPPRNVWREVYHGRWSSLSRVQKAEFLVEITFWILFIGAASYLPLRDGYGIELILMFGTVTAILVIFSYLLTRSIR